MGTVLSRIVIVALALLALAGEAAVAMRSLAAERPLVGASFGLRGALPDRFEALADRVGRNKIQLSPADLATVRAVAVAEPLSPVPFVLLGATRPAPANARLVAMAQLRDPRFEPVLTWMLSDALQRGDTADQARALIRLVTLRREDSRLYRALVALSASPPAFAVIKAAIGSPSPWRETFLLALNGVGDPAVVFQLTQASSTAPPAGAAPALSDQATSQQRLLTDLIAHQEYDRAYLGWVQWLGDDARPGLGLIFDGTFKHYAALAPFNWDLPSDTGSAAFAPKGGLSIDYAGTDPIVLARQTLLLPPGVYHLMTHAKIDGTGDAPVAWMVSCVGAGDKLATLPIPIGAGGRASAPFAVSAACPAQALSLEVPASDFSMRASGTIQSVAVERVTP